MLDKHNVEFKLIHFNGQYDMYFNKMVVLNTLKMMATK